MTPKEVLAMCRQKDVKAVDLRFTDMPGKQHHVTVPVGMLQEDTFEAGLRLDGASFRGWQAMDGRDMLAIPQANTAWVDPFPSLPTLVMQCNIQDAIAREESERDPRTIASKATSYLESTGIADSALFGAAAEFFVFDNVRFEQNEHEAFFSVDSEEAEWNRGQPASAFGDGPNLGHHVRHQQGFAPTPPIDQLMDLRNSMMQIMLDSGLQVESHHHAVSTAGQCAINLKHSSLTSMADAIMTTKYVVKNVAKQEGKTSTFMPKPILGSNGSGLHTRISLWKAEQPLFAGSGYAGLSETAMHAMGGLLKHAPTLLAFTNPTTNSFKRLASNCEAPVNLAYSQHNRSAACRVPMHSSNPKAKRIEFRCPDPSCNPYIAFAAMLMAVIDGIQNKISPGEPLDEDAIEASNSERRVTRMPRSLEESLDALETDHAFLTRGDVFTVDAIRAWVNYKRQTDVEPMRARPHPYEFCLYYDA